MIFCIRGEIWVEIRFFCSPLWMPTLYELYNFTNFITHQITLLSVFILYSLLFIRSQIQLVNATFWNTHWSRLIKIKRKENKFPFPSLVK